MYAGNNLKNKRHFVNSFITFAAMFAATEMIPRVFFPRVAALIKFQAAVTEIVTAEIAHLLASPN